MMSVHAANRVKATSSAGNFLLPNVFGATYSESCVEVNDCRAAIIRLTSKGVFQNIL